MATKPDWSDYKESCFVQQKSFGLLSQGQRGGSQFSTNNPDLNSSTSLMTTSIARQKGCAPRGRQITDSLHNLVPTSKMITPGATLQKPGKRVLDTVEHIKMNVKKVNMNVDDSSIRKTTDRNPNCVQENVVPEYKHQNPHAIDPAAFYSDKKINSKELGGNYEPLQTVSSASFVPPKREPRLRLKDPLQRELLKSDRNIICNLGGGKSVSKLLSAVKPSSKEAKIPVVKVPEIITIDDDETESETVSEHSDELADKILQISKDLFTRPGNSFTDDSSHFVSRVFIGMSELKIGARIANTIKLIRGNAIQLEVCGNELNTTADGKRFVYIEMLPDDVAEITFGRVVPEITKAMKEFNGFLALRVNDVHKLAAQFSLNQKSESGAEEISQDKHILALMSDETLKQLTVQIKSSKALSEKINPSCLGMLSDASAGDLGKDRLAFILQYCKDARAAFEPLDHALKVLERGSRRRGRGVFVDSHIDPLPDDGETLFLYPHEEKAQDVLTICKGDARRLEPCKYLNDNLIDLRLRLLHSQLTEEQRMRVHLFTCLFYEKLTEGGGKGSKAVANHALVERWTKSVDLFDKQIIMVPVNESTHWSLTVLVHPNMADSGAPMSGSARPDEPSMDTGKADKTDSPGLEDLGPCILFLDSLGMHKGSAIAKVLREYLRAEYSTKHPDRPERIFDETTMPLVDCKGLIPKQSNGYDCGMYVCKYGDLMLQMIRGVRSEKCAAPIMSGAHKSSRFHNILRHFLSPDAFDESNIDAEREVLKALLQSLREVYEKAKRARELERQSAKRRTAEAAQQGTAAESTLSAKAESGGEDPQEASSEESVPEPACEGNQETQMAIATEAVDEEMRETVAEPLQEPLADETMPEMAVPEKQALEDTVQDAGTFETGVHDAEGCLAAGKDSETPLLSGLTENSASKARKRTADAQNTCNGSDDRCQGASSQQERKRVGRGREPGKPFSSYIVPPTVPSRRPSR